MLWVDKAITVGSVFVDYEAPDEWQIFKKTLPPDFPAQMLRVIDEGRIQLELVFVKPTADSPLAKAKDAMRILSSSQDRMCSQYIQSSVEEHDTRSVHASNNSQGYISIYTDKLLEHGEPGFKYLTCISYLIKSDNGLGILVDGTLLSDEKAGSEYEAAIALINSLRVRK